MVIFLLYLLLLVLLLPLLFLISLAYLELSIETLLNISCAGVSFLGNT